MMFTRFPVYAVAFLSLATLLPGAAQAEGLYLKALGGLSSLQDASAQRQGVISTQGSYKTGFAAGSAVGYGLTPNFSTELEFLVRKSKLDKFDAAQLGTSGDYASVIVSLNALYTFDGWSTGANSRYRPFVGFGLGLVDETDFDVKGGTAPQEYEAFSELAWQARAGVDWEVNKDWSLTAELRYLDAGTPSLEAQRSGPDLKAGYSTVDLLVGVTYRF